MKASSQKKPAASFIFFSFSRNVAKLEKRKKFEADDEMAFSEARKVQAEKALEKTMRALSTQFGRGTKFNYVGPFTLPWGADYPD